MAPHDLAQVPLSYAAGRVLADLERRVASAEEGPHAAAWFAALLVHHLGLAREVLGGQLQADVRLAAERADEGPRLGRDEVAREAGRQAVVAGRDVVAPQDLVVAIVALVQAASQPTQPAAPVPEPVEPTASSAPAVPQPAAGERVVRVFVSSTFRDMQAEREELVKRVFPALRRLCESRGVTWGEVDLRWGITDEQAAEGQVLPVCLAEIERCRPFFIGLLGQRYGWVPDELAPELVSEHPWLADLAGRSVTELEIAHGVLNDPSAASGATFYVRDPAYLQAIPAEQRPAFEEDDPARARQLEDLEDRVRASGAPVREYASLGELGELVLADLTAIVDRLFPADESPDPLEREAADHEAFLRSRSGVYIGGQGHLDRLERHVASDAPPLVVVGDSGSGKSALLANWVRVHRRAHPQDAVLAHFVGATPASTDWAATLRRLMGELSRQAGIDATIPDRTEELRPAFANWLHLAANRGRVVLAIDALDGFEDREGALDLTWLPPQIPANVRLVVSTLPGRPLEELSRRGWPTLAVQPLDVDERRQLIAAYLAQYRKQLAPARVERLAAAPPAANPLFLRVLLEELRLWGEHESLDERIDHYLAAADVPELYRRVFARWEADYGRDRPGLVAEALSLLWAARRGLSEAELLDLLGTDRQPLPSAHWSPFRLAAEASLGIRGGLLGFGHDQVRRAVEVTYLAGAEDRAAAHRRLADYFAARGDGPRVVEELPWQLAEAGEWTALRDLLVDPAFFARVWEADEYDAKAYWTRIEAGSPLRATDAYRSVVDDPDPDWIHVWYVSTLLADGAHLDEARVLTERLAAHHQQVGNRAHAILALERVADIMSVHGEASAAAQQQRTVERWCREEGDRAGLARSLISQAGLATLSGRFDDAVAAATEAERAAQDDDDRELVTRAVMARAVAEIQRDHDALALDLLRDVERDSRSRGDQLTLALCLGNQVEALIGQQDLRQAMQRLDEAESTLRAIGDRATLRMILFRKATISWAFRDASQALQLMDEATRLCREVGDVQQLVPTLRQYAQWLTEFGDVEGALDRWTELVDVARPLGDQGTTTVALALANRASLLARSGRGDEARRAAAEATTLARAVGMHDLLADLERLAERLRPDPS